MDLLKILLELERRSKIRRFELVGILLSNGDFLAMNGVSGTAGKTFFG
jgi:hypothetical protein